MKNRIFIFYYLILIFFSCKTYRQELSYPYIQIPEFESRDYNKLLSDKNSEVVYNAICNLNDNTVILSKNFYDASSDKNSEEYKLSKEIYDNIKKLTVKNNNSLIVSSGLKFLYNFVQQKDYQEIITIVEKINNNSFTVNFEKINLLNKILNNQSKINKKVITGLLNDRSWIISRNAYSLVNITEDENLRSSLVKKYKKLKKVEEKLLILTAFKNNYSYGFFEDIVLNETKGDNQKIKNYLFSIFRNCKEKDKITQYLINNYEMIKSEDMAKIMSNYKSLPDNQSVLLYINIIKKGYEPDRAFYESLINESNSTSHDKDYKDNLKILTEEIKQKSKLRINYDLAYREMKREFNPIFIKEYDNLLNDYLNKFEKTSIRYNVDKKFIDEYKKLFSDYLAGDKLNSMEF